MKLFANIKGDKVIWMVVVLLSIVSILVVYSSIVALAYRYKSGDTEYYLFKHSTIIGFGLLLMYGTHNVKYTFFSRLSQIALIVSIPLLVFTLLKGVSAGEATRWLKIPGTSLTFQTSDFAKLALISYVARMLAIKQDKVKDFKTGFLPIVLPVIAVCGLILPANFSTAALLFLTCLVLMFIGRVKLLYLFSLIGIGIVCLGLFIAIVFAFPHLNNRVSTWKTRIESYSSGNSQANYQVEQAKIAIALGGPIGRGPGGSTQRNFLPQASSDFIYAIFVEEYGLVSGFILIFLYLILFFRAVRIAGKCEKTFAAFLAIGLSFSLVFQAMINMAVAVNLFPVTGQPLPLISMGGTSIWFTSIALGMILSVSVDAEKKDINPEELEAV